MLKKFFNKNNLIKFFPNYVEIFDKINDNAILYKMFEKKDQNFISMPWNEKMFVNSKDYQTTYFTKLHDFFPNAPITYLEFGVGTGESFLINVELNKNPDSTFVGFDTFTGWPEIVPDSSIDWDVKGIVPPTTDSRVKFVKGLFQETFDDYFNNFKTTSQLVIHINSYTYSSTLFCLTKLDPFLKTNSIITFGSFGRLGNESRAFYDYTRSYYRDYGIILSTTPIKKSSIILK